MSENFVDLRLNHHASETEEGFWPSFTDIMTVIVMIFMLVMVILLIRNMELVNQLRATMEAEQQAMELALSTGAENETLEEQLIAREHDLSMLRLQLLQMEEQAEQQEAAIASQRFQISSLSREKDELQQDVSQLETQRESLSSQLASMTDESARLHNQLAGASQKINALSRNIKELQQSQTFTQNELESLSKAFQNKESELAEIISSSEQKDLTISSLQQDYSSLKIKYDKLIKPARTAKGKTVVEVRYRKESGRFQIFYKGPAERAFNKISQDTLESKLDQLKQQQGDKLYIKVIIPKDSGLSYNEAWSFTNSLHKKYNYYFQQAAKKERIIR